MHPQLQAIVDDFERAQARLHGLADSVRHDGWNRRPDPQRWSVAEFERLQAAQIASVRSADGLPITRVKIRSPFNSRVKYTLYSALTILPAHQHRHLWQAEQAWEVVRSAARP